MRNFAYLLIAPMLVVLASCGNNMPPRKSGQFVNVNFIGHDVSCDCPTFAPVDRDLELKLEIPFYDHEDATWEIAPTKEDEGMLDKPVEEYYVRPEDIKILIGGKEYPDSWYFYYRHNDDNLLKIRKEYVVNDITIEVTSRPFGDLFLYGMVIGDELLNRWVEKPVGPLFTHDLFIDFQTFYQRKQYPIKTIDGQQAFPVLEHDNIDVTFKVRDGEWVWDDIEGRLVYTDYPPLPDDIRFRCNSRYTYMGIDYIREYSDQYEYIYNDPDTGEPTKVVGYRKCHITVPHYIVMDHVSFRQYGTE